MRYTYLTDHKLNMIDKVIFGSTNTPGHNENISFKAISLITGSGNHAEQTFCHLRPCHCLIEHLAMFSQV